MAEPSDRTVAAGIRPELELLLCCARTDINSVRAEGIRALLRTDLDWTYLIQTAVRHGVMPLLYGSLKTTCPDAVPRVAFDQLRDCFFANAGHNLLLTEELLKLLNLLEAHDIPAIPFKGPVLAASVYGSLALRQFADLDILVRRQDVRRARDLLLSQRYRLPTPLTDAEEAASRLSGCEYCLVREDSRVVVDLHWGLTTKNFPFPLAFKHLQEHLEPLCLAGTTVMGLAPEDLLLILCVHGSKHLWTRLEWICDLAELVRARPDMDWGRVMERAQKLGGRRMLFLGLLLGSDLLGTTLPEGVRGRVQADPVAKLLAREVRDRLFCEAQPPLFVRWLFRYRVRERWRDRWPSFPKLMSTLVTPTARDRALLPLPASLFFLYYLIRLVRLVGEYVLGPLGRSLIQKHTPKLVDVHSAEER